MGLPIFYTDPENINMTSACIALDGDEAKHAVKSLRVKKGDRILIGDGCGNTYAVRVSSAERDALSGGIESVDYADRDIPSINVYQAVSKPKHIDEAIVRNAETGVERMIPFVSERSPQNSLEKVASKMERWKKIARESSKLSRRKWPLEIGEPLKNLSEAKCVSGNTISIVLWEDEAGRTISGVLPAERPESIGLVVGPEGGFSKDEVDSMVYGGAIAASMGDLILRTESAAAYAAMLIRFRYGILLPGSYKR